MASSNACLISRYSFSNERSVSKEVSKGTGLGLAIARQIVVEKHCGTLEDQSQVGLGTEFCLRVPIGC